MLRIVIDAIISIIFTGSIFFGAPKIYDYVKKKALIQVNKGLSSTYQFSKSLTGEQFDWEE